MSKTQNPEDLHDWLSALHGQSLNRYNIYLKSDANFKQLIAQNDRKAIRERNWAIAMTGTSNMIDGLQIDKIPNEVLEDCNNLTKFFSGTYINHMTTRDELSFGGTKYLLAAQGRCYIAYTDNQQGTLGIKSLPKGKYKVQWYDIENGELSAGEIKVEKSDDYQWNIPDGFGKEVALYLVKDDFEPEFRSVGSDFSTSTESTNENNHSPSVESQKYQTSKNTPVNIPLYFEDKDGGPGPYIITILKFPEKGSLKENGGKIIYTPNGKEKGIDQIQWQVSDGINESQIATVDIVIAKK
jgi:hypothetical protein